MERFPCGKFKQETFIEKGKNSFLEYDNIEDLLSDQGEDYKSELIGYFPKESNVTYQDLIERVLYDASWVVTSHIGKGSISYGKITYFSSTIELRAKIDALIAKARSPHHVNIYPSNKIVFI